MSSVLAFPSRTLRHHLPTAQTPHAQFKERSRRDAQVPPKGEISVSDLMAIRYLGATAHRVSKHLVKAYRNALTLCLCLR